MYVGDPVSAECFVNGADVTIDLSNLKASKGRTDVAIIVSQKAEAVSNAALGGDPVSRAFWPIIAAPREAP